MEKNICFIENYKDIELVSKKQLLQNTIFIPLNLETFLFCKKKKFEIFDFKNNILNQFHKKALFAGKKFIDGLKFNHQLNYSLKSEIIFLLRFRLNSVLFIIDIINNLKKKYVISSIIVSGINKKFHTNLEKENIASEIIDNLYGAEYKVVKLSTNNYQEQKPFLYRSQISEKLDPKKKKILLSNVGYNFLRFVKFFKKKNVSIYVPFFNKVFIIKKIYYYLKGFKPLVIKKKRNFEEKEKIFIKRIDYFYNSIDLSYLLNNFYNKYNFYFNEIYQHSIVLKNFINKNNFSLTISNITKGIHGSILDKEINCNTLCVPHGIIAKAYNEHDEIYKKTIAEAVFNGESKFFAIQSKITERSLDTHAIEGKKLTTGNLIFASIKKSFKKKKYILQASTLKDFSNMQFLGVEMFYEYWDNLSILNRIAKDRKYKIIVKPHPTIKNCTYELQKIFKNLKFSNKSIDHLLKRTSILISYSSSVIEDSLNSFIPVILFDKANRYMHINPFKSYNKILPINYVSSEIDLIETINCLRKESVENFDKYVFKSNFKENIDKSILTLI